jgi:hypothetical protein
MGLLLALVAAIAVVVVELRAGTPSPPPEVSIPPQKTVQAASLAQLRALPTVVGHPVYWAGPRAGASYEITRIDDGRVYISYAHAGASAGSPNGRGLTIGTYEMADPVGALRAAARAPGVIGAVPGGGVSYYDRTSPSNVYLAYPGSDEQVEVYDPSPAEALRLVERGDVRPVPPQPTR